MSLRKVLVPVALTLTLLLQFLPGTFLAPRPVAASACDSAQFIADVTIADGTILSPGSTFVKTWRFQNIGTCTWSTSYALVFTGGDQLGAPAVVSLPSSVGAGGTVDVSVNMTAPSAPGHYRGYWKLRNSTGTIFGVGGAANYFFWVDINVNGTVTAGTTYDFVANYCSALWASGAGGLDCHAPDGNAGGFVLQAASPQLETGGTSSSAGLVVNPQKVSGGYIKGFYPAYTVHAGDHFQSIINCAYGATGCYVNFQLQYQIGGGAIHTFWSFNERYDGLYYPVNLDLSSLAGQSVNFILYMADVPGHGTPSGDRATWVGTKITGPGGGGVPLPPPSVCNLGSFVTDVTIPDGTVLAPGTAFTKTWRIRNVGSCTWSTSYALVYVFGNSMGTSGVVNLPSSVAPGVIADFSVNMVAPTTVGHYRSYWRFRDGGGTQFGVGSGMVTFFSDIYVSSTAPTSTPISTATAGPAPTSTKTPTPTSTATVGTGANLSVTINDFSNYWTPNTSVSYTAVVSNAGPLNVTGAVFHDSLPAHVTSWTWSCSPDFGATCGSGLLQPDSSISDTISIPAGKQVIYHILANLGAVSPGNLVNAVTVSAGAVFDPDLGNNVAVDSDEAANADLSVTINDSSATYVPGATSTYTVTVTNNGPSNVVNALVSDTAASQITSFTWTCAPGSGTCTAVPKTGSPFQDFVSIPVGTSIVYTVVAHTNHAATGSLANTVNVAAPADIPDLNSSNNTAVDTDTAQPSADLVVTMNNNAGGHYHAGNTIEYIITITNNGPSDVTGAAFSDTAASQVASWTWWCTPSGTGSCNPGAVVNASSPFTDTVNIPAGESIAYTVDVVTSVAANAALANTATITVPAGVTELVPANNNATNTIPITP